MGSTSLQAPKVVVATTTTTNEGESFTMRAH
jgi:hypothetical protein